MQAIFVVVAVAMLAGLGYAQDMPLPGVCGVSNVTPKSRIVNGEAVTPHSRPYQLLLVAFFDNGTAKYYCGASLIKTTHVLTAAHCVAGTPAKNIRLFPGIHDFTLDLLSLSNGVGIQQYFTHESYNNRSLSNDIAVIRLQIPLIVDNEKVGLACLADPNTPVCAPGNPVVGKSSHLFILSFAIISK